MPILAQCGSCQKKFKAGDQLAGKKVKCPQCSSIITIPQPQSQAAASAPPPPPPPSPFQSSVASILDEEDIPLQAMPKPVATPAQPARTCPGCGAGMAEQAVLCVHCGFDTRSGRKLEVGSADEGEAADAGAAAGKKKKKKRNRETPQGLAFLYGCAASFGFALVGSVMWWIAFYFTGFEFGIIAWVLGGMAGGGMAMAYGHEEMLGGLAAAAMAFLGIWAANAMILATVFANPEKFLNLDAGPDAAEEEVFDEGAEGELAEEEPAAGVVTEGEAAGADAAEEFAEEEMPAVPAGAATAILGIALLIGSFVMCFAGFFKILWLIFALSTAYKIGSGGNWSD